MPSLCSKINVQLGILPLFFLAIHLQKKKAVLAIAITPIVTVITMITLKFLSSTMYKKSYKLIQSK